MTKKGNAVENTPAIIEKNEIVNVSKFAEIFAAGKEAEGKEITTEYLNFEAILAEGESIFLVAKEMTQVKNTFEKVEGEGMTDAVLFESEQGENLVNSDSVIVSTISREFTRNANPFLVEIMYLGKKKSAKGSYRNFKIIRKSF